MLVFGEAAERPPHPHPGVLPQVAMTVSVDLRSSQRQTYLLDLHGFRSCRASCRGSPTMTTVRGPPSSRSLELGGTPAKPGTGPEADRIVVEGGDKAHRKLARRAVRVVRGAPLPDGAPFARRGRGGAGVPGCRIPRGGATASTARRAGGGGHARAAGGREVRGRPPSVGDPQDHRRPLPDRRLRGGLSREEMRVATVRALLRLGFLDPRVEIAVVPGRAPRCDRHLDWRPASRDRAGGPRPAAGDRARRPGGSRSHGTHRAGRRAPTPAGALEVSPLHRGPSGCRAAGERGRQTARRGACSRPPALPVSRCRVSMQP